jgi:hypothetical protein
MGFGVKTFGVSFKLNFTIKNDDEKMNKISNLFTLQENFKK